MERLLSPKVMTVVVALLTLFVVSSCVNEEYDMSKDNLNLEVTPFQEGIALPLGSTDTLRLKELLKDVDVEVLKTLENGAYAVSLNDSFDMTEELASLSDMIKIDDVVFTKDVNFRLNAADVSDVRVDEIDYSFQYDIASDFKAPDLRLPSITENLEVAAELYKYVPEEDQLSLSGFPSVDHETHFMSISEDFHIPEMLINDTPVALDGDLLGQHVITDPEFDGTETVHVNVELPKGVASVEDIILHEGAKMRVTLELRNSFLHSGKLIPEIDVDLHEIFHLDAAHSNDHVNLEEDFVLSEQNDYKQTMTYSITSLAISGSDWKRKDADSPCVLDKDFVVPAKGKIHFENLMTTTRKIENNRNIDIYMKLEFIDLQIDDIKMTIDPVTVSQESEVVLVMDELKLPEEVEDIRNVVFTPESGFDISIKAQNIDKVDGLDAVLESFVLTFPEEVKVEGANERNELVYNDVDLSRGLQEHVHVIGLDVPEPVDGKVNFSDNIKVKAVAKASGTIHSADLPKTESEDVKVAVDVKSEIEVEDYEVTVEGFEFILDVEPESLSVPLPEETLDLGEVYITPAGNPLVSINIDMPDVDFELIPSANGGVCLSFPQMFRFKTPLPAEYNYRESDNSITLSGNMPKSIELPIESLLLVPEKDPTDGKVYAKGEFKLDGGLTVATTVMNKEQVEVITSPGKVVKINAHIPELVPSGVDLDHFETRISEKIDLNLMGSEDMPKELVSVGRIDLDNVFLNVSLDASELPDLGSTELTLDFTVNLPDMVKVSGVETDTEGNITLSGKMNDKGVVEVEPVRIDALDMTGYDLKEGISDVIELEGFVKFSDASLDVDEWLGKDLNVTFKADIKDIKIAKITGKVDYQVDPIVEAVDLSEFAEAIGGEDMDMELDFNHAHLALEVSTNLGVPVVADVQLVPYYNGKADESKTIPVALTLDPAESADQLKVARFYLANPGSEDRCPAGYEFVEADIIDLIRNLPEKLEFRMNAGTDPERECVLEPSAEYTLKADYAFELPLEFGEKFNITFKDTLQGLPEIVGQLVSKGKIKIGGDITSSLPLGLEMTLNLLDSEGRYVPMDNGCGKQTISPCRLDGSAVKTELDLMMGLQSGVDASDIASLELMFKATSAGAAGVPLTEDSFLHANIHLILPEGITIDLSEITENDEQ